MICVKLKFISAPTVSADVCCFARVCVSQISGHASGECKEGHNHENEDPG